jgi:RHS repeat-associated protein
VSNEARTEAGAFTTAVTKYYYFGSKRVAMRGPDDAVVWLHGDHLGSTSLATDAAGDKIARRWYDPFGAQRAGDALPTDFGFTGQREAGGIGLYDYHARFYDPYLNRFIQADTIVPEPGNPQHFNRYSYVRNNPLNFTDPSGHKDCGEYCAGDLHSDEHEVDWFHPAVGQYYYDIYMNDPELYVRTMLDNPMEDTLLAAEAYAEIELGVYLRPFGVATWGVLEDAWRDLRERRDAGEKVSSREVLAVFGVTVWMVGTGEYGDLASVGGGITGAIDDLFSRFKPRNVQMRGGGGGGAGVNYLDDVADDIGDWLGDNPTAIINQHDDLIVVSGNGMRRFRIDLNHPAPHENPHMHLDWLEDDTWHTKRIWPLDVEPR